MTHGLFPESRVDIDEGVVLWRGRALARESELLEALAAVIAAAPLRHMLTPGGLAMSVAMSNCGELGWISDRAGYRYAPRDPLSGQPWPALPALFTALATSAAADAGFPGFVPDACLVNEYRPGARLSLHQDRDERDFAQPIVSVSLGVSATFLFGGLGRKDRTERLPLHHGDVLVWGGPARLRHHGVLALKDGTHPVLGARRINLTLRHAG
jgi:alkylated DNA repair protein (DNA oxidative demethylase)